MRQLSPLGAGCPRSELDDFVAAGLHNLLRGAGCPSRNSLTTGQASRAGALREHGRGRRPPPYTVKEKSHAHTSDYQLRYGGIFAHFVTIFLLDLIGQSSLNPKGCSREQDLLRGLTGLSSSSVPSTEIDP